MITVTSFRSYDKGPLVGFFNLDWNGFFINKCKLFSNGKGRWFAFPSEMFEKDGEKKYAPYCGHKEPSMRSAFQDEVLKAIDAYLAAQPKQAQQAAPQPPADPEFPFGKGPHGDGIPF